MKIFPLTLTVALFTLLVAGAHASDADLLRCRGVTDAPKRLACYDGIGIVVGAGTTTAPLVASGAPVGVSSNAITPAPTVQAAVPAVPEFGFEDRKARGSADRIESQIVGNFEGWSAHSRVRLANGQVWQVSDDSSRSMYFTNPKVVIRRGLLGAYYLEIDGTNYSPRVKRVE